MAYSLRPRVANALLRDEQEYIDGTDSSEEDHVSLQSESDTEFSEAEDAECPTENQRVVQQRSHSAGRPTTTLRSKDGTTWSTTARTRTSG